ncbi:MAG TPA: hypothetical protein VF647_18600 [Longimicrobium sp.]|jgi:hypothetical protein
MLPRINSIYTRLGLLLVICLLSGTASYAGKLPRVQSSYGWPEPSGAHYTPTPPSASGEQVLFVFVGSSACRFSSVPELPGLVEDLKMKVAAEAKRRETGFATIGVAIDSDFRKGVNYLKRFGYFDEVTAGNGHYNSAFVKYVYEDMPGDAATPQILVIQRSVTEKDGDVNVTSERLLRRLRGVAAIAQWARGGAALPSS